MDLHRFFSEGIRDFDALLSGKLSSEESLAVLAKAEKRTRKFFNDAMAFIESYRKSLLIKEEKNGQVSSRQ